MKGDTKFQAANTNRIITCNDYNPSQFSEMGTEQGVRKGIKMVDANIYVSNALDFEPSCPLSQVSLSGFSLLSSLYTITFS